MMTIRIQSINVTALALIALSVFAFVRPAEAQLRSDREFITGEISAINSESFQITVLDYKTQLERNFTVQRGWSDDFEKGKAVAVIAMPNTDVARLVRLVQSR